MRGPRRFGGWTRAPGRAALASLAGAALILPFIVLSASVASAQTGPMEQVVVKMTSPSVHASSVLAGLPGTTPQEAPGDRWIFQVHASQAPGVVSELEAKTGRVQFAEVAQAVHADSVTPNDPCYSGCGPSSPVVENPEGDAGPAPTVSANQSYLQTVNAPAAWSITTGSSSVVVGVLDTGVDVNNPDLVGKVISGPNICARDDNLCGSPNNVADGNGHGTHVSGIVAANTNNGVGVASIGWNTTVEMFKVLDSEGAGTTADVATGIYDAVAAGVKVISMSFSNDPCDQDPLDCGPDPDEQAAVNYALDHGVVVVAAAGNSSDSGPTYPGAYPGVLSVAATDNTGTIAPFSEWGEAANIAAPGVAIVSTWNDGNYAVLTGTSMSAPEVAAAAALVIAANPTLSGQQVTSLLQSTSRAMSGGTPIAGGLLNVGAAVSAAVNGPPPATAEGYDMVGADGSVYSFGSVLPLGGTTGIALNKPMVGMAVERSGLGYWLVASDGGIFAFGQARYLGSTGGIHLNKPIVGMAATPDGGGYWLVASDGGIFTFGDARFFGSMGGTHLNQPIVGMAATPDGGGYWLVASDGGIFTFGDAKFFGSEGAVHLNKPINGMASTPDGGGYWMVASDGGIFTFGDARFFGSAGGAHLTLPAVGMIAAPDSGGYWIVTSDGTTYEFGDANFYGSLMGTPIPAPLVGVGS